MRNSFLVLKYFLQIAIDVAPSAFWSKGSNIFRTVSAIQLLSHISAFHRSGVQTIFLTATLPRGMYNFKFSLEGGQVLGWW